jgi:hypothetical protein
VDHAEAQQRLQDALLAPGKLDAVGADETPDGLRLSEHLASCAACRRELEALRETSALLALAAPDDLHAPPEARERVLRAVANTGAVRVRSAPPAIWRRWSAVTSRLAMAAALGVLVVAALVGSQLIAQRDQSSQQARELARLTAATDLMLREPDLIRVTLLGADGRPAGSLLQDPSEDRIVVVAQGLPAPPAGERYGCYLERDGERMEVGWMRLSGDLAYWAGPMDEPSDAGRAGDRFIVVPEHSETPVLEGTFGPS